MLVRMALFLLDDDGGGGDDDNMADMKGIEDWTVVSGTGVGGG
jgi:hypothetical protein